MTKLFPVAILAGGLATRLQPLTEKMPKALINIAGEPFIAHQLRLLRKNNIDEVVLCVGFLGEQIREFVGDGRRFGLRVSYVFDGAQSLGTGGAIKQALSALSEAFFILYGDSYLPCNFSAVQTAFEHSQKLALMTVFCNQGLWDSSNVEFSHDEILAYDKKNKTENMRYIDYGLSVVSAQAFRSITNDIPYDLADFYQFMLKQKQLAGFEIEQRFYEIGSFSGIDEFNQYIQQQKDQLQFKIKEFA